VIEAFYLPSSELTKRRAKMKKYIGTEYTWKKSAKTMANIIEVDRSV
jgi:hypothetical protein